MQNVIERCAVLTKDGVIRLENLPTVFTTTFDSCLDIDVKRRRVFFRQSGRSRSFVPRRISLLPDTLKKAMEAWLKRPAWQMYRVERFTASSKNMTSLLFGTQKPFPNDVRIFPDVTFFPIGLFQNGVYFSPLCDIFDTVFENLY
ncbi:MAG: hypothetical protein ACOYL3_06245 [Desulfuromonadaceae bacterium]